MNPRTNFDVINKSTGDLYMSSRCKDCFGQYTNSIDEIGQYKNHIIKYYLPDYFTRASYKTEGFRVIPILNDTDMDKVLITDDQIETYLSWLNKWNFNVRRIDDVILTREGEQSTIDSNETNCKVLEIDLTECVNIKHVKLSLFFSRYIINKLGSPILKHTFEMLDKHPEIDNWDAFILSEIIYYVVHNQYDYIVFCSYGPFKYLTLNEFWDNVIIKNSDDFNYLDTYSRGDLLPVRHANDYTSDDRIAHFDLSARFRREFKEAHKNLSSPELLEFWKNYNWK